METKYNYYKQYLHLNLALEIVQNENHRPYFIKYCQYKMTDQNGKKPYNGAKFFRESKSV